VAAADGLVRSMEANIALTDRVCASVSESILARDLTPDEREAYLIKRGRWQLQNEATREWLARNRTRLERLEELPSEEQGQVMADYRARTEACRSGLHDVFSFYRALFR
jgi:hypothetical protein